MTADPSWFLSTTAQSAAALVAIVGGLLVSRVVSMAADRQGVVRRLRELGERDRSTRVQLQEVFEARHRVSVEIFQRHMVDAYVAARGNLTPQEAVRGFLPPGATADEMVGPADVFGARVRKLVSAAQEFHASSRRLNVANLRSAGYAASDEDDFILDAIRRGLGLRGDRGRRGEDHAPTRWNDRDSERQDRRIEQEVTLRSTRLMIDAERSLLMNELAGLSRPGEVWAGLAVLTYFAIAGVVVPLICLASRPVPDSTGFRRMIVALFLSGLLALVAYIVVAIRRLGRAEVDLTFVPADRHVGNTKTSTSVPTTP